MGVQYYCRQKRRQQAVREHATLNGIHFLEVLDLDAPPGSPRQRTLLIQLLKPLDGAVSFGGGNVEIRGGVRITNVGVEWAARASEAPTLFADGFISAAERDLLLERDAPDAGDLLVVRTDAAGDFSTYVLALVDEDAPLATLDPPLSEVAFSFKVECPADFDCAPETVCPPTPRPLPPIDYLARDYASFRRLMLDRMAVVMPEWKERSPGDIGVALVEVLAYAADRVSYYQDAVATEAYLDTARRRASVRRHARLLDYPMHDGVNARAWVALRAEAGVENVVVPREYLPGERTRLLTHTPSYPALLDRETYEVLVAEHHPQVFELLYDLPLFAVHNRMRFHTWGDDACCLPRGATRATLRDAEAARLLLVPGDVLVFQEVKGPGTGAPADADPAHRHAVRLTRVTPGAVVAEDGTRTPGTLATDALFEQPIVEIEWGPEDALPFPLCLSVVVSDEDEQETLVEDVSVALGNVALADHGRTLAPEALPVAGGDRWYRPHLAERPVTQAVPFDAEAWATVAPGEPGWGGAAGALLQDPRRALPAVTLLDSDGDVWRPERDLLASDRFDPDFVAEVDNDGGVVLRFGDDVYARRPKAGATLDATYRIGTGPAGNVGAGAIFHLLTTPGLGVDASDPVAPGVTNPLPAVGGAAAESLDEVRLYAPQAFRRQERAVTEADYAEVSERHAEVSEAVARRLWTGSWHTMFVTVDRLGGRPVDAVFESELHGWLDRYKLAGHDVEIAPPRFIALDVALTVCVKRGYFRSDVKQRLLETFSSVDLPGGGRGYFHPDNFTFGQPVYLSHLIARAMEVPGVRWVEVDSAGDPPARFQRWGELPRGEIEQGLVDIGRLEIARLDNDRNAPENGRIVFHMEGWVVSAGEGVKLCRCGCCEVGGEADDHVNAPGLSAIAYRVGTYPDFLARMTARVHAWELATCASCEATFAGPDRLERVLDHIAKAHPEAANPADLVLPRRPLAGLGTRAPDDPAIALMDVWAVVGDVLTFYQERIANEGYLRTATERRSVLALARAIGYELDPGVAAETYLAFTVEDAEGAPLESRVPVGTQIMSVPASRDELPQTFETAEDFTAHVARNALRPRLRHPLALSEGLSHVFLQSTATGVRVGQAVLLIQGTNRTAKRVARVTPDNDLGIMRVDFTAGSSPPSTALPVLGAGVLDPGQEALPLTRANVDAQIFQKTWQGKDLLAFLTMHGWDAARVMDYVDDLRAASFAAPGQQLLAFREKLGFFGHNAPLFASLPDLPDDDTGTELRIADVSAELGETLEDVSIPRLIGGSGPEKAWPYDWDAQGFSIWQDSLTNTWYSTEAEPFDVYLERAVPDLSGGTWAVFERLPDDPAIYRVQDVTETSRAGFGMSAKVTGLQLHRANDIATPIDATDKPTTLHFRRSIAHVKSEAVPLAWVPLTDPLTAGTSELRLDAMVLGLQVGQVLALTGEEVESDGAVRSEMVRLDDVSHAGGYTTLFFEEGLVRGYLRDTVTLNANVVLASHGEAVADEVLGSGDGSAKHQRFVLRKPPLTHRSAVGGSESALEVRVDGVAWEQVGSLYGLDGARRAYTVRIDDDANATVVFGDGSSGARLPTGQENVRATYRSGLGTEGEVDAGALKLLKTRPFGVRSVTNPLPASGADDPETLDDARGNAPLTVLTLDRVVSLRDYEDYARAYPGVGKARADAIWNGESEIVHVTVADANGDAVVEPLYGRLLESIEGARDPLPPLRLASYQPFVFFVDASVKVDEAYRWEDVEAGVLTALREAFGFAARCFGQPVTAAEVLQVMHRVPGVVAVDLNELYRTAPDAAPSGSLFNAVIESRPARFDAATHSILPAELLLIHEFGIELSEMDA